MKNIMRSLASRSPTLNAWVRSWYAEENHSRLTLTEIQQTGGKIVSAWKDSAVPMKQLPTVQKQLAAYRAGKNNLVFDALVEILVHNIPNLAGMSLLEVGCSSGYYSEVFSSRGLSLRYKGCDFSPAFIELAQKLYPMVTFDIEDATSLSYTSESFDVVLSGGCILHVLEFEKAIAEAARTAREYVVFHRTPILHLARTSYHTKRAYGTEVLEVHFNEQEFVRHLSAVGLQIVDVNSHSSMWDRQLSDLLVHKTYLCRKARAVTGTP